MSEPTLNEVLAMNGYTTQDTGSLGKKDIIDSDGVVVATLNAAEAWAWLSGKFEVAS